MEARKVRRADRALRPAMRSPGRPPVGRREHRVRFWEGDRWWVVERGCRCVGWCVGGGWFALVPREWRDGPIFFCPCFGALFVFC